jgi:hypothetical protein
VPISRQQDDRTAGCLRCHSLMVIETFVDYESGLGLPCFLGWRCLICGAIYDPVILLHQSVGWELMSPRSHGAKRGRRLHHKGQRASPHPVGARGGADP